MEEKINFEEYYNMVLFYLKKDKRRNENYFDTLDLLINAIMVNNDFTELEKVARLRDIVYSNGSLSKKKLMEIDKELGYEKYYEESC